MTAGDVTVETVRYGGEMYQQAQKAQKPELTANSTKTVDDSARKDAETSSTCTGSGSQKYSLRARSIQKRIETEHRQSVPRTRQPRPKSRPPPLSKYRRKTANARERDRMKDINAAFQLLERAIPDLAVQSKGEKVTKITVLRLAIRYIKSLSSLLELESNCMTGSPPSASSASCTSSPSCTSSVMLADVSNDLPDPLDNIEGLTDFQLPGGFDMLLDMRADSDCLDFSCSDFSDLPSP